MSLIKAAAGELLGAGSFGRVYRGRWNGMEVAVKVIEHDTSSAVEVENEVLLMMGLQHECIVAAYNYCWAGAAAERPSADQLVEAVGALIAARESQQ
ncbi:hypothetical protein OEZ85_013270 [Tetradesmus obliquus]|uniref:Serine-threonine/tyrosine-protein kinase catalytic domain-containing protein n=1 Tax=Tetradesmus obliquus TaxID=3088 RepID=A0ABY8U568_TETOB|nr:hypothetical protein OEZ85_013270 [Tetradesmus obliquus]